MDIITHILALASRLLKDSGYGRAGLRALAQLSPSPRAPGLPWRSSAPAPPSPGKPEVQVPRGLGEPTYFSLVGASS